MAGPSPDERLRLYRQVAGVLDEFFGHFTAPFCTHCLEVTRCHHRTDPRADVDLVEGLFPGCCHAGVGDALWVPRSGEEGRFSSELAAEVTRARRRLPRARSEPMEYRVRERISGRVSRGVACVHLDGRGCRLGDLKGPLCAAYLCEPVREAIAAEVGWDLVGSDTDDFAGALEALRAAVSGEEGEAKARLAELRDRLERIADALMLRETVEGRSLWQAYNSSAKGSSPSVSTR